jgi:hypothetical protein
MIDLRLRSNLNGYCDSIIDLLDVKGDVEEQYYELSSCHRCYDEERIVTAIGGIYSFTTRFSNKIWKDDCIREMRRAFCRLYASMLNIRWS